METGWERRAADLGLSVISPGEHERRWLGSLGPESAHTRASRAWSVDRGAVLEHALDAAVGVARAAERLQSAYLGSAWEQRVRRFQAQVRQLALPELPPPGCEPEAWRAIGAVMNCGVGPGDWQGVAELLPDEVQLIDRLQRDDPAGAEHLATAAEALGRQLDRGARRELVEQRKELTDAQAFRRAWTALFGKPRRRPAAPTHLAVHILDASGLESSRDVALFLDYVGLLHASTRGHDDTSREESLLAFDNEVHNARRALRRLREEHGETAPRPMSGYELDPPAAVASPEALVRAIEWVTIADLRRVGAPRTAPPPSPSADP